MESRAMPSWWARDGNPAKLVSRAPRQPKQGAAQGLRQRLVADEAVQYAERQIGVPELRERPTVGQDPQPLARDDVGGGVAGPHRGGEGDEALEVRLVRGWAPAGPAVHALAGPELPLDLLLAAAAQVADQDHLHAWVGLDRARVVARVFEVQPGHVDADAQHRQRAQPHPVEVEGPAINLRRVGEG